MVEEENVMPAHERMLADRSVFISKLQGIEPGSKSRKEVIDDNEGES